MYYDIIIGQEVIFKNEKVDKELGRIIEYRSSQNGIVDTVLIRPYMTDTKILRDINTVTLIDPLIKWRSK
jgi:hypothetical protein